MLPRLAMILLATGLLVTNVSAVPTSSSANNPEKLGEGFMKTILQCPGAVSKGQVLSLGAKEEIPKLSQAETQQPFDTLWERKDTTYDQFDGMLIPITFTKSFFYKIVGAIVTDDYGRHKNGQGGWAVSVWTNLESKLKLKYAINSQWGVLIRTVKEAAATPSSRSSNALSEEAAAITAEWISSQPKFYEPTPGGPVKSSLWVIDVTTRADAALEVFQNRILPGLKGKDISFPGVTIEAGGPGFTALLGASPWVAEALFMFDNKVTIGHKLIKSVKVFTTPSGNMLYLAWEIVDYSEKLASSIRANLGIEDPGQACSSAAAKDTGGRVQTPAGGPAGGPTGGPAGVRKAGY